MVVAEASEAEVLSWHIDGSPEAVRQGLAEVLGAAAHRGTPDNTLHATETVLAEVLNNVVEHAYAGNTEGWIAIQLHCVPPVLDFTVLDGGLAMPEGVPPPGQPQNLDVELLDLPEGGFGWLLIRTLTEGLTYRRERDRNVTSFRITPDTACHHSTGS